MSGSVAVVVPGERTVESEECMPANSEGCNRTATKAAADTGAPEATMQAAAPEAATWAVASVTGT